jgi:hypothetical protein
MNGAVSLIPIVPRRWVHIAISLSHTQFTGYIDGQLAGQFDLPLNAGSVSFDVHLPPKPNSIYFGRHGHLYKGLKAFISNVFTFENFALTMEDVSSLGSPDLRPLEFPVEYLQYVGLNSTYLFETAVNRTTVEQPWGMLRASRDGRNYVALDMFPYPDQADDAMLASLHKEMVMSLMQDDGESRVVSEFEFQRQLYLLAVLPPSREQLQVLRERDMKNDTEIQALKVQMNSDAVLALAHRQQFGFTKTWHPEVYTPQNFIPLLLVNRSQEEVVGGGDVEEFVVNNRVREMEVRSFSAVSTMSGKVDEIDYMQYHKSFDVELPINCRVALSLYDFAATNAFNSFDMAGIASSLVEDIRLWDPKTVHEKFDGEDGDVMQFQIQAAERGEHPAQLWVAQQLYFGRNGMDRDQPRALEYFHRAAGEEPEHFYQRYLTLWD